MSDFAVAQEVAGEHTFAEWLIRKNRAAPKISHITDRIDTNGCWIIATKLILER
ncbi:hypothetical protein ACFL0H_10655 [Thermodesulfobacteriota bacterium]